MGEGERWRPDEAQRQRAEAIGSAIGEELFDRYCQVDEVGRGRGIKVTPEDPHEAGHLYDPECWPVVLVTGDGARFEVDVDVTVRALPDVATQVAAQQREVAALRAAQTRRGVPS